MEIDAREVWQVVRPIILRIGAKKVLARVAESEGDISLPVFSLVNALGPEAALRLVSVEASDKASIDKAVDAFLKKTNDLNRLPEEVALLVLDTWAEDEEGTARVAAHVVEAFGRMVGRADFDRGYPGSGEVVTAWKLGRQYFMVGELGVCALFSTIGEVRDELKQRCTAP